MTKFEFKVVMASLGIIRDDQVECGVLEATSDPVVGGADD